MSALDCPGCGVALVEKSAGKARLSACAQCGGVWLSKDAARVVITHVQGALPIVVASEKAARAAHGEAKRAARCPVGGEPLAAVRIEGVEVDVCAAHGAWFEAGEVRLIANAHTEPLPERRGTARSEPGSFDLGDFLDGLDEALDRARY